MKARFAFVVVVFVSIWIVTFAAARPGGGQSFGGSSSSSSSGGSRSFGGSSSSSSSSGGSRSFGGSSSSSGSSSFGGSTSSSGASRSTSSSSSGSSSWGTTSPPYSGTSSSGTTYPPDSTSSSSGSVYVPSDGRADRSVLVSFGFFFLIAVLAVIVAVVLARRRQAMALQAWEAGVAEEQREEQRATHYANIAQALASIRSIDDAFSYVLFEDFLYALYTEAHTARGAKTLDRLSPYVSDHARAILKSLPTEAVSTVIVGGMRVESIETEDVRIRLSVVFTSNLTERDAAGQSHAYYMEERWTLERASSARSRPPEKARVVGCPSCGAPLDKLVASKCGYCGAIARGAEQDWYVTSIDVLSRESRGPMLTGTTEEVGTDLPTVVAPDVKRELDGIRARDPSFTWPAFVARIDRAFQAFHASWGAQDLRAVRPYLSDNLYELQSYWVKAYQEQHLRNLTEGAHIVTVHLARVQRDRFFHAITVRVFASCLDYTLDQSGAVVGGDRKKPREYSEYWTFIRGAGRLGAPRSDTACPSCGGSLEGITMAGKCGHCGVKVTSGDFDWVLSRIEQDEVYEAAA